jgi:two-component system, chemotaxis family, CheB/CheR fusion protein
MIDDQDNHREEDPLITNAGTEEKASRSVNAPTFVVGIGASAGGLESLEKLFQNVPKDTGMAFVVIQHLSPDFKSMMYELLGRDTDMTIHRIEDGMVLEANHVYLLPPKKELEIAAGRLRLIDKDLSKGLTLPIDRFFESLAHEFGSKSIAIVLSGSGSDGSRGVGEIAHASGLVIAETPETAKFDGMPLSSQATGYVDLILSPDAIGNVLVQYAVNPFAFKSIRGQAIREGRTIPLRGMDAIYALFRQEYDLDFSCYKETTVNRRIARRMSIADAGTIEAYAERLQQDRAELNALYEDLLIGVTQFFRDDEAFNYLSSTLIPDIVRNTDPERTIRAWVCACATGEEAYSLAILFHEAIEAAGRPINFKMFATDVHKKSLVQAGRGIFREDAVKNLSPQRLKKYFERKGDLFQISQDIRESIVFAPHNILRDAPFTDLDFVSCRNLLIYFQPGSQTRALSMFHFGLNPNGVLFLGSSESPSELSSEFETIDEHNKVYRKWRQSRLPTEIRLPLARRVGNSSPVAAIRGFSSPTRHREQGLITAYDHLLTRFMPPSLLINANRELIDSFGGAEKLLRLQARRPSLDILELIDPKFRTTLLGAIQRCITANGPVRFSGIKITTDAGEQGYNLSVEPIPVEQSVKQYLITFEAIGAVTPPSLTFEDAPDSRDVSRVQIQNLEEDLRFTKENLQATIEELETSNEELQATNEELVASNEELQSTNEELHSVNEELYTVNAEHQRKISELAEVNQDMHHLLENTDVATLFLDSDLKIRKFTARVRQVFDILDQDIGRPIASFAHHVQVDDLVEQLSKVRDEGKPIETEVMTDQGECFLLRILPYRTKGRVDGVVVTMVDLAPIEDLRGRLRWMSAIVESTEDAVIGIDLQGIITSWNRGAEHLYGYTNEEVIGKNVSLLLPDEKQNELDAYLSAILRGEPVKQIDTVRLHRDGTRLNVALTVSAVRDGVGRVIGLSKIARDITQRVEIERELRDQARQRENFLAMLSHELRNPLGAILSAVEVLHDSKDTDTNSIAVKTIGRQSTMMGSLLNDLLDVSRISEGKIELQREKVDLVELIDVIQETTMPVLTRHRNSLQLEVNADRLYVEGDADRLVQIQVNLINNAAKYSPDGSAIRVQLRGDQTQAIITVTDQGMGIAEDFLPRIFEPFVQSSEAVSRSEGGLGVGLTLVRSLTELHGGTVEAHSQGIGKGSTFVIRLPLHADQTVLEKSRLPSLPDRNTSMAILIVDDIEDNLTMLKAALQLKGYRVATANEGIEALRQFSTFSPEVAIVDIGLPGMNGYEVAQAVRSNRSTARTYLIALTGYGQPGDVARAMSAGFDMHMTKPMNLKLLLEVLRELKSKNLY